MKKWFERKWIWLNAAIYTACGVCALTVAGCMSETTTIVEKKTDVATGNIVETTTKTDGTKFDEVIASLVESVRNQAKDDTATTKDKYSFGIFSNRSGGGLGYLAELNIFGAGYFESDKGFFRTDKDAMLTNVPEIINAMRLSSASVSVTGISKTSGGEAVAEASATSAAASTGNIKSANTAGQNQTTTSAAALPSAAGTKETTNGNETSTDPHADTTTAEDK